MALVTIVVPWAREAQAPVLGARVALPLSTPSAGVAGVVGPLHDSIRPARSQATRSVKVPPTSTPMRTPSAIFLPLGSQRAALARLLPLGPLRERIEHVRRRQVEGPDDLERAAPPLGDQGRARLVLPRDGIELHALPRHDELARLEVRGQQGLAN